MWGKRGSGVSYTSGVPVPVSLHLPLSLRQRSRRAGERIQGKPPPDERSSPPRSPPSKPRSPLLPRGLTLQGKGVPTIPQKRLLDKPRAVSQANNRGMWFDQLALCIAEFSAHAASVIEPSAYTFSTSEMTSSLRMNPLRSCILALPCRGAGRQYWDRATWELIGCTAEADGLRDLAPVIPVVGVCRGGCQLCYRGLTSAGSRWYPSHASNHLQLSQARS